MRSALRRLGVIIKRAFLLLNLLSVFLFLLSCLAPYISPQQAWVIAFIGLGFFPLLLTNISWVIFWLLFKRRFAFFSAVALLIGWWNISCYYNLFGCPKNAKKDPFSV